LDDSVSIAQASHFVGVVVGAMKNRVAAAACVDKLFLVSQVARNQIDVISRESRCFAKIAHNGSDPAPLAVDEPLDQPSTYKTRAPRDQHLAILSPGVMCRLPPAFPAAIPRELPRIAALDNAD
jgi:hypothetical protein